MSARGALLAVTLLFSYAYFYQGTGWNQNSHFDLARALAEQHSVCIDLYQSGTGDKAFYQGHYYSDKAPGLSLASVPAIEAGGVLARELHVRPRDAANVQLYLAAVLTSSFGIALAGAVLFAILLSWGCTPGAAAFAVVVFGLGTPMWIYATQFWGHALASACLVFAFAAAERLRRSTSLGHRILFAGIAGLAAGWAVVTEYPAAVPAAMIGAMALVYCRQTAARKQHFFYPAAALAVTAGVCLATIMVYQKAAFGSPFRLGYQYVVNYRETLRHGALGVAYPKWHALLALLFGKRCGLLLFAPILMIAPLGFRLLWRSTPTRLSLCVSAGIAIYYILFNASYLYWQAGASFGPRYLSPGLPFACLFVAPVWQRAKTVGKALLVVVASYGVVVAFAGVTTHPVIPEAVRFPIRVTLPAFARGELYSAGGAWNLGLLMGLQGVISVTPLLAVWAMAMLLWWCMARAKKLVPQGDARPVSAGQVS